METAATIQDEDTDTCELVLVFTAEGQVELEEAGEMVWSSDDDDQFQQSFGDEFLEPEHDTAKILNWLMSNEWLDEEEAPEVEVEVEDDGGDESEVESD